MKTELESSTATVCAPPAELEWHQINWNQTHSNVRRLQARIVKAVQDGRWGKVKALQHLLTHSFSGKAIAVKRVTENRGKNTPGVDKETWSTPKSKSQAVLSFKSRGYKAQPLRRIYIPKANGKRRPLGIPTMKDRAMQALYLLALEPVAETTADLSSYGFRPERSCADAIEACFQSLGKGMSAQWVLEGDIKGCFDNISHEWIINNVPMDKVMLRKWLKAGFIEKKNLFPTEAGTPQGGIISPVLANLTLDGLESLLKRTFRRTFGMNGYNPKVNMIRYADDFVITGCSKELLENEVKPLVEQFLATRGLVLSQEKTKITHIEEGFDFLGKNVRKYDGKILIKPSKRSILEALQKVRGVLRENKSARQGVLINLLNPVIRGWANYYASDVSGEVFSLMEHRIWRALWNWAKRRHPKKNTAWIKNRYFIRKGARDWIFACDDGSELLNITSVPIRRHVKIQSEANPFDLKWEEYFEQRLGWKMQNSLSGSKKLRALWRFQKGICPICNQKITVATGWENHHVVWKSKGGSDGNQNRVLLHINCHRKVHSQKLTVKKPASQRRGLQKA